jgi:hypothetical protein
MIIEDRWPYILGGIVIDLLSGSIFIGNSVFPGLEDCAFRHNPIRIARIIAYILFMYFL